MPRAIRTCLAGLVLGALAMALAGCDATASMSPLEKAQYLLKQGKWQEAITAADEAIKAKPDEGAAFACRAKAYLLLGNRERSLVDYSEAIRLAPSESESYYQRAIIYKELGELEKSQADERIAKKLDPTYSQAFIFNPDSDDAVRDVLPDAPSSSSAKSSKKKSSVFDDRRSRPKTQAEQFSALNRPEHPEDEQDSTDRQIEGLKQKQTDYGAMSTTVQDSGGQPLVVDHRSMTEQLFGVQAPKPGEPLGANGWSGGGFGSPSRPSSKFGAGRTPGDSGLLSTPRLSQPVSTAIGPPVTGAGPIGPTGPSNSLGQNGYGLGGTPMHAPGRSPYVGTIRSTGIQDPEAAPRRSISPYGPIASPYAPAASPGGYGPGGGYGAAGPGAGYGAGAGQGYGAGAGRGAGSGFGAGGNPYGPPASPYNTGLPAGGRRELGPSPVTNDLGP